MHDQTTAAPFGDSPYEQAVLRHILDWQPTVLRLEDLIREVSPDPREFSDRDDVERAVRDLIKVGLLYREGECVLPTTAAVFVQGLEL